MFSRQEGRSLVANLKRREVEGILLDNDGVLSDTNPMFVRGINNFVDEVALNCTGVDREIIRQEVRKEEATLLKEMGVHPDKFAEVARRIGDRYPQIPGRKLSKAWSHLVNIYNEVPPLYEGVKEALGIIALGEIKLVMVTNRWEPWHEMVTEAQGLKGMFAHEEVVDCHRLKTKEDWKASLDKTGLSPDRVLGAGDNKWGDIRPLYELGVLVENLAYIHADWSEYARGELPAGVESYNSFVEWVKSLANEKK